MSELENCCGLVIAAGLATGHADTHIELMEEVLAQCINAGPNVRAQAERIAELEAEVEGLREQSTCVWDHNAVTENYPCGCCGYPNGLKDARRIPPPPQEQSE